MKVPWPFRHLGLKVLSVAFAALLWLVVSGDETVERGLRVPLEFQQFPSGLELKGDAPSLVDVRVRGASSALSRLAPGDLVAELDLKAAQCRTTPVSDHAGAGAHAVRRRGGAGDAAERRARLRAADCEAGAGGAVDRGRPGSRIRGRPGHGFARMVEVIGPESAVARVTEAVTEAISVAGARAAVSDTVTVGFVDPAVRLKTPRLAQSPSRSSPGRSNGPFGNGPCIS